MRPSEEELVEALAAAGRAHHEFETEYRRGERDEQWPGWYAAFVIGRLGGFATPTRLARWLESAPTGDSWAVAAGQYVLDQLDAE